MKFLVYHMQIVLDSWQQLALLALCSKLTTPHTQFVFVQCAMCLIFFLSFWWCTRQIGKIADINRSVEHV